jgi:hypothetical protein
VYAELRLRDSPRCMPVRSKGCLAEPIFVRHATNIDVAGVQRLKTQSIWSPFHLGLHAIESFTRQVKDRATQLIAYRASDGMYAVGADSSC